MWYLHVANCQHSIIKTRASSTVYIQSLGSCYQESRNPSCHRVIIHSFVSLTRLPRSTKQPIALISKHHCYCFLRSAWTIRFVFSAFDSIFETENFLPLVHNKVWLRYLYQSRFYLLNFIFQSVIVSFQNLTVRNTVLKIAGGDSVYKQLKLAAHAVKNKRSKPQAL